MQRLKKKIKLELASPHSDAKGGSVDHKDQPAIPVGGSGQDLKSFENEGGSIGDEHQYERDRKD